MSCWGPARICAAKARAASSAACRHNGFKAEFAGFNLYRDGELVRPITPGRAITAQSVDQYLFNFVDEAYSGLYAYGPEAFMTGKEWRLEVFDSRVPGKAHKAIVLTSASKLIQQIRRDFEGVIK
jgi:hypothetical protein